MLVNIITILMSFCQVGGMAAEAAPLRASVVTAPAALAVPRLLFLEPRLFLRVTGAQSVTYINKKYLENNNVRL